MDKASGEVMIDSIIKNVVREMNGAATDEWLLSIFRRHVPSLRQPAPVDSAAAATAAPTSTQTQVARKAPARKLVGCFDVNGEPRFLCGGCEDFGWSEKGFGKNVPKGGGLKKGWTNTALSRHWENGSGQCTAEAHYIQKAEGCVGERKTGNAIFSATRIKEFNNGKNPMPAESMPMYHGLPEWLHNCKNCECGKSRRGKPQFFFCLFAADGERLIGPWNNSNANAAEYSVLRQQLEPPPPVKKDGKKKVGKDNAVAICACAQKDLEALLKEQGQFPVPLPNGKASQPHEYIAALAGALRKELSDAAPAASDMVPTAKLEAAPRTAEAASQTMFEPGAAPSVKRENNEPSERTTKRHCNYGMDALTSVAHGCPARCEWM